MPKNNPVKVPRLLVFSAVSTLILIILYFTLGRLIFKYEERAKGELKNRQTKLQESQELIRSVPNPQKAIEEIEKKVEDFKDMGVSKKQLPRLMQVLGQAASLHKVTVISLKPREDIRVNGDNLPVGVNKIFMEMTVGASFKSLADFIKALGELPMAFNVESLTLEKTQDNISSAGSQSQGKDLRNAGEKNPLRANLLLSTYMVWEL
jgi:Tfp pilus assembly protein PilO